MYMRTREPLFMKLITREIKSWFGELEDLEKDSQMTIFELMNRQLNIDLLYAILVSISQHTVG